MFRLEAPYPALASTILLPSPKITNNLGLTSQVNVVRMMDGSRRSFVKRASGKKLHRFQFVLSREKMEEFVEFVERYRAATYRANWRNEVIIGKATLNPAETVGAGRAGGWPGGEAYSISFEIVEV